MIRPALAFLALVLLALAALGCGSRAENYWHDTQAELGYKAHLDLGPCQGRQYTVIRRHKRYAVAVAVEGCGVSALYEKRRGVVVSSHKTATWTLISRAGSPYASPAPTATPALYSYP